MKTILTLSILTYLFCFSLQALELEIKVYNPLKAPIKNIVVYLEKNDGEFLGKTEKTIEIKQVNKSFAPYISVIQSGNTVLFHNQDDITHHIYSPIGENKFAFKIKSGQQKTMDSFTHTGEVTMGCNIHDWMSGYLLILDTPYFDKTNEQGVALLKIENTGDYKVTIWHPQMNEPNHRITQNISLTSDQKLAITLTQAMSPLPEQKNDDDFDFLSDY